MRAVLLCWSEWTDENDKQLWFHDAPKFLLQTSGKERECSERIVVRNQVGRTHVEMVADSSEGRTERWNCGIYD